LAAGLIGFIILVVIGAILIMLGIGCLALPAFGCLGCTYFVVSAGAEATDACLNLMLCGLPDKLGI